MELQQNRLFGGWLRYGSTRISAEQEEFAIAHYRVAVLQPWEVEAATRIKRARPDLLLLCYKCLSSTRSYEPGPIFSSGVSFGEAQDAGEHWFAHRPDGSRIEWSRYEGHWQMAVWDTDYQQRWCDNVEGELKGSPFDGVMADNDVFDDYYDLRPPLHGGRTMSGIREALGSLVDQAGRRLNQIGKILVPNIAEARREEGRWARHAAYGGGYEEVYLAWGPTEHLEPSAASVQAEQAAGPGFTLMRTATDGSLQHSNARYGLAAFWVFGGGTGGAYTATAHDSYDGTPLMVEMDWDLGQPLQPAVRQGNAWSRTFTTGWAAVNLDNRPENVARFETPPGMIDSEGAPPPPVVSLPAHHGVLLLRGDDRGRADHQHPAPPSS